MTPAEELRQAAEALRKRAAKAQEKSATLQELNNWFNSLGPEIGDPLARILESHTAAGTDADSLRDAVKIARAVNAVKEWPPEQS